MHAVHDRTGLLTEVAHTPPVSHTHGHLFVQRRKKRNVMYISIYVDRAEVLYRMAPKNDQSVCIYDEDYIILQTTYSMSTGVQIETRVSSRQCSR